VCRLLHAVHVHVQAKEEIAWRRVGQEQASVAAVHRAGKIHHWQAEFEHAVFRSWWSHFLMLLCKLTLAACVSGPVCCFTLLGTVDPSSRDVPHATGKVLQATTCLPRAQGVACLVPTDDSQGPKRRINVRSMHVLHRREEIGNTKPPDAVRASRSQAEVDIARMLATS
jgi:hypothetical protein